MAGDLGVLYVAFGRPYMAMALLSASTVRRRNPSLPICIITNVQEHSPNLSFWDRSRDRIIFSEQGVDHNRHIKTSLHEYSPFEKTIFLDCDTKVLGSLEAASFILDHFDIGLRLNPYPQTVSGKGDQWVFDCSVQVKDLPHWNSGVMLFRSGRSTREFFRLWHDLYLAAGVGFDQVSLVEAVFRSRARILSLERRWNATDPVVGRKRWRAETRVFHYASNISNRLFREVLEMDAAIPSESAGSDQAETRQFLMKSRSRKCRRLGRIKYVIARIIWTLSSPT